MILSEEAIKRLDELRKEYPSGRGIALPALYAVQDEHGWVSQEAITAAADYLNMPKAILRGVATFYSLYRTKPTGRHLIQLCTNVSCMIFGAERLVDMLKGKYQVEPGRTSPDGRFSLMIMECIGACDKAPAMIINGEFHYNLDEKNILDILESYR